MDGWGWILIVYVTEFWWIDRLAPPPPPLRGGQDDDDEETDNRSVTARHRSEDTNTGYRQISSVKYYIYSNTNIKQSLIMATRGLMAENMFIGQSALLQWLNGTLSLRLEKIEEVGKGGSGIER